MIKQIKRSELENLLAGDTLRKGKMLEAGWPRITDKKVRQADGTMAVVEPAGTLIRRRLILRSDWSKPTKTFTPAGGIMFNVESKAKADAIKEKHDLYLFLSLEGITHPFGEPDHPVNVPLDRLAFLTDTRENVQYLIK